MRTLLFIFCLIIFTPRVNATNYYVSPNGNDLNSGTSIGAPFKSITAINQLTLNAGDSVLFERDGEYLGELILKSSGSSIKAIVIADYGTGNLPIFTGSKEYTISPATLSVYCPSCVDLDNLITHKGSILIPARYPNTGYLMMSDATGSTSFKSNDLTAVSSALTGAVVVAKTESWVIDRFPVNSFSGNEIQVGSTFGFHTAYSFKKFNGFFLTHDKSFLDQDNEWYFDTATDYLYVNSASINKINVAEYDNGISLQSGIANITIKNLVFKEYRTDGISMNDNSNISIDHCEFYSLGNDGIGGVKSWSSKSTNTTVANCTFKNTLNSAINLLFSDKATISYNTVSNSGLIPGQGMMQDFGYCGINAPKNATIEWNKIDSAGYNGLNLGSGNNSIIRYNEVANFGLSKNDCGGIYCWSAYDLNIHNNYVHNGHGNGEGTQYLSEIMNSGIYLDDKSYNITVKYNTVENCYEGLKLHNAYNNVVQYNTLYNNTKVQLTLLEGYPYYGAILKGNTISYNSLQAIYPSSYLVELFSAVGVVTNFAAFDYNTYNNPYNNKQFFLEYVPLSSTGDHQNEFLSFSQWRSKYSQDLNSTGTFDVNQEYGETALGSNLILNSTFEGGLGWWWDYGNSDFSYSTVKYGSFSGNALRTAYASTTFSASHLGTSGFSLDAGKSYLLSFKTQALKSGHIKLAFTRSSEPYIALAIPEILGVELSTTMTEHFIPFKVGLSSSISMQFHSTSSDGAYYLDDVILKELTYDTTASTPFQYSKLFVNNSASPKFIGTPTGYIHQSGDPVSTPITLAPFTSIVLKQNKGLSVFAEDDVMTQALVKTYPNPAQSYLLIDCIKESPDKFEIVSLSGQVLKSTAAASNKIDVEDLSSGIYFVRINFQGKIITEKFIKE